MGELAAVAILTTVRLEEDADALLRLAACMSTCLPLTGEELVDPGVVLFLHPVVIILVLVIAIKSDFSSANSLNYTDFARHWVIT